MAGRFSSTAGLREDPSNISIVIFNAKNSTLNHSETSHDTYKNKGNKLWIQGMCVYRNGPINAQLSGIGKGFTLGIYSTQEKSFVLENFE